MFGFPFQVPQNSFGIWPLVFGIEGFAGTGCWTSTSHPEKIWAGLRCLCATRGKGKRQVFKVFFCSSPAGRKWLSVV